LCHCNNSVTPQNYYTMKTDAELQTDIQRAMQWEPLLESAEIGVIANDGAVYLTGAVDSYAKKLEAANTAKKVIGVKVLVDKVEVKHRPHSSFIKNDSEITKEVLDALKSTWSIPKDKVEKITATVENGWVTLEGELPWYYQKEAAKHSLIHLKGVLGVINNIRIKSEIQDTIEKKHVEDAIGRSLSIEDGGVNVSVSGSIVTLTGTVKSLNQKEEAGRIAWNTPGIGIVKNELAVDHEYVSG
jgi:osmotically-inducible protein OsmY